MGFIKNPDPTPSYLFLHDDGLHAGDVAVAVQDDDHVLVSLAPDKPIAGEAVQRKWQFQRNFDSGTERGILSVARF